MAKPKYKTIKGMSDVMPPESMLWNYIEGMAKDVFTRFGCVEIRTPVLEKTELFVRSIGEATSVVEKEMYSFLDRNEESLSLRPEGTASVVRAYIDGHVGADLVAKYYYMGPMFRYERPQKGRKRQFHQIGVEVLGVDSPSLDADVMAMFVHLMDRLDLKEYTLEINSIGCKECRPLYNNEFKQFLEKNKSSLCADCLRRIEKNPLRAFDCKVGECIAAMKDAPVIGTHICKACEEHFKGVCAALELLKIPYKVNHRIVRGLDYYSRTAFEFTTDKLGAQNAICAGGRYDGLVHTMGGQDVGGVGFSIGVERLILLMQELKKEPKLERDSLFFVLLNIEAEEIAIPIIDVLRRNGVNVERDYERKSLKSQMRRADRVNAHTVVIIGESELEKGTAIVRNMHTKEQKEVELSELARVFDKRPKTEDQRLKTKD